MFFLAVDSDVCELKNCGLRVACKEKKIVQHASVIQRGVPEIDEGLLLVVMLMLCTGLMLDSLQKFLWGLDLASLV